MMLDLFSDGAPSACWTTDLNGAGEEKLSLTLGRLNLSVAQPGGDASEAIGTGALVWPAGPAVAQALMASGGGLLSPLLSNGRVIELGCGCSALPGVAMALAGAAEVLVTDSAAIVAELRPNLAAYCAAEDAVASSQSPGLLHDRIIAQVLAWDDPVALGALARDERGRSVVLAADCDYADILHSILIDAVSAALSPTTSSIALFATAARCQRTLRLFLSRLNERGFATVELSASLEEQESQPTQVVANDAVRYIAARWRSADEAGAARARFIADADLATAALKTSVPVC